MTDGAVGIALYTVGVGASVVLASAALSRWAAMDVLDRALVGVVYAVAILSGVPLVLAMIGALSSLVYLGVMLAIGAAGLVVQLRSKTSVARAPSAWSLAGIVAVAIGTAMGVLALFPTVDGQLPGHHDTRTYHIGNLFEWYSSHSLWNLPFQNPGFFTSTHPANAELATIGTMFAEGGNDGLLYTANILFGALVVLACTSIARDLGGRPHQGAMAAMAVLASPLVFGTQAHGLATDLPAAAGLLAGVATLLRARREPQHRVRWLIGMGAALGFGLGTKYTVVFLAPLVIVAAFVVIRPRRDVLFTAPGLVVLAAPWFVRNWVETGNPLFPQGITLFGTEIFPAGGGPLLVLKTPIAGHVLSGRWGVVGRWADLGWDFVGPAVVLAIAGVLGAFLQRPRHRDRLAFAALAIACWVVYVITPYTGGGPTGLDFLLGSNLRYTLPALLVGVALASVAVPSRLLIALTGATFLYDAYKMLVGYTFRSDLDLSVRRTALIVVVVLVVITGMIVIGRRTIRPNALLYLGVATAACVAMMLVVARINSLEVHTPLERAITASRARSVVIVGSDDMRSIVDANPEIRMIGVSGGGAGGEIPPRSVAELTADIDASGADALVIRSGTPGVPQGYQPPPSTWRQTLRYPDGDVYVRVR